MKIIFHHPLPLDENAKSASGIRPIRMLEAFRRIGYEVDLVVGYASQREMAIAQIKRKVQEGIRYDFVYSESSTMPMILTEKHHFPLHPLLDQSFFKFCKNHNIFIGLFYRDIYWRFKEYRASVSFFKSIAAKISYYYELWVYKSYVDILYLPTYEMAKYLPFHDCFNIKVLAPAYFTNHQENSAYNKISAFKYKNKIKLFYVGGVGEFYRMHVLFEAVSEMKNIELVVCTRKPEWEIVKSQYCLTSDNISVIHFTGQEMLNELNSADICMLFVEPSEYWSFCSAVKLFEYTACLKPIIASTGILDAKLIEENNIGWVVDYDRESIKRLINEILIIDDNKLEKIFSNLINFSRINTWEDRAKQVASDIRNLDCNR
jgi:glycosyltransferase involved in cell wall biosynthesis